MEQHDSGASPGECGEKVHYEELLDEQSEEEPQEQTEEELLDADIASSEEKEKEQTDGQASNPNSGESLLTSQLKQVSLCSGSGEGGGTRVMTGPQSGGKLRIFTRHLLSQLLQ